MHSQNTQFVAAEPLSPTIASLRDRFHRWRREDWATPADSKTTPALFLRENAEVTTNFGSIRRRQIVLQCTATTRERRGEQLFFFSAPPLRTALVPLRSFPLCWGAGRGYRTGVFIPVALLLWCYLLFVRFVFWCWYGVDRALAFAACVLSRGCCPSPTCEVSEVCVGYV